jgi:hypothetical protein
MRLVLAILCTWVTVGAAAVGDPPPSIGPADAGALLFGSAVPAGCDTVECLIEARYRGDAEAQKLALALFADTGDVAGVGADEVMDGGYRGKIHLVPQPPVAKYRQQLAWTVAALRDIDAFFAAQFTADTQPAYRWRALGLRYVRSVGKRTPSAWAGNWRVNYNVDGSLMTSATSVRETLFHEVFHLNDEHHGDWSRKTLGASYDAIVARCGTDERCLAPFAPNDTVVRGGTYYAFQPNNGDGVHEYAAELAVRYFKEQTEMRVAGKLSRRAFKCGPAGNGRAWQALVDEFFAGVDRVPAC